VRKVKPAKFKREMNVFAGNETKVGWVVEVVDLCT